LFFITVYRIDSYVDLFSCIAARVFNNLLTYLLTILPPPCSLAYKKLGHVPHWPSVHSPLSERVDIRKIEVRYDYDARVVRVRCSYRTPDRGFSVVFAVFSFVR